MRTFYSPHSSNRRAKGRHPKVHLKWLLAIMLLLVCSLETFVVQAQAQAGEPPSISYGSCTGGLRHRVRQGETLSSIAARYGTTADRIARCSGLASPRVTVGQILIIPSTKRGSKASDLPFWVDAWAPQPLSAVHRDQQ